MRLMRLWVLEYILLFLFCKMNIIFYLRYKTYFMFINKYKYYFLLKNFFCIINGNNYRILKWI